MPAGVGVEVGAAVGVGARVGVGAGVGAVVADALVALALAVAALVALAVAAVVAVARGALVDVAGLTDADCARKRKNNNPVTSTVHMTRNPTAAPSSHRFPPLDGATSATGSIIIGAPWYAGGVGCTGIGGGV